MKTKEDNKYMAHTYVWHNDLKDNFVFALFNADTFHKLQFKLQLLVLTRIDFFIFSNSDL